VNAPRSCNALSGSHKSYSKKVKKKRGRKKNMDVIEFLFNSHFSENVILLTCDYKYKFSIRPIGGTSR